ncbi:hypothetical protein BJY52DRAFT_414951 [Lactarius psammicola]|nr:hypothetical protein BJY52DRAFT_414951 [Lactarius psammicola]
MTSFDGLRTLLTGKKKLVPAWILCCIVAAATVVCVSIVVGWQLRISDLEGSFPRPSAARSVLFELDLVGLDPLQNIITLDWWIIGDDCNGSSAPCPAVNIYVNPDEFLNAGGSTPPSDNGASQPAFQHNPTTSSLGGRASRPAFRTQLNLHSYPLPNRLNLVDYPFDKYATSASIFARTNNTGEAVGAWIYNVTGAAFGFATTLGGIHVDANTVTSVDLHINRAMSVKLYVITIIVGMWLISLALMTATIKALIFRHKIETAVLVLPVATMIAFAQLRGSMPDAPAGFGTNIDILGSLPTYVCLVMTTVCALAYCLSVPAPGPRPTKQLEAV